MFNLSTDNANNVFCFAKSLLCVAFCGLPNMKKEAFYLKDPPESTVLANLTSKHWLPPLSRGSPPTSDNAAGLPEYDPGCLTGHKTQTLTLSSKIK